MALTHPVVDVDHHVHRLKVLIADDHPLIVAGLRRTLDSVPDMHVVGEARSLGEMLTLVERRAPDVVVVDLMMPGVSGTEAIEQVHGRHPDVKIVVLSACEERPVIDAALAAGASAFVLKSAHHVDLASVLRNAASGAVFHAPASAPSATDPAPAHPALTERERSILSAIASGMTTSAISRELWISEHTIKFHLTNIYRKLRVSNRASAIRYALEHGIA